MAQPIHERRPPERSWREQDLSDLPEDGSRYEIIDGSLHVTPPAGPYHHELADDIRMAMRQAAPKGWRVIREIGVQVPAGNLTPDITVLKVGAPQDRMWAEPADVALVYRYELVKEVHYNLLGTVGPDDPVEVTEPWPMRLNPSTWPR